MPESLEVEAGGSSSGTGCTVFGLKPLIWIPAAIGIFLVIAAVIVIPVVLTLPEHVSCKKEDKDYYTKVVEQPTVDSIAPFALCAAAGDQEVTVTGKGFLVYNKKNPTFIVGEEELEVRDLEGCTKVSVRKQTAQVCTSFKSTIPQSVIQSAQGNKLNVSIALPLDKDKTCVFDTDTLLVVQAVGLLVYYVDPPSIYNGISLSALVYTSGLNNASAVIELRPTDGSPVVRLNATATGDPNQRNVLIPAGLAPGFYDVGVSSDASCIGVLSNGLHVISTLTVDIDFISPSYIYTDDFISVTIKAKNPPTPGFTQFQRVPTVFISPSADGSNDTLAVKMRAVNFEGPVTITGVVPTGLTPGNYDLIVVNPDDSVGVLLAGLVITDTPTPVIYAVTPNSLKVTRTAVVVGANFDTAGVTMKMLCQDPRNPQNGSLPGIVDISPGTITPTSLTATFHMDTFTDGTVCLVIITNSNNASFTFSAISKKSNSGNLIGWFPDNQLNVARRGHTQVGVRPTPSSRFLYVIGGDNGTVAGAMTSVEVASINTFGSLQPWELYPSSDLPEPRVFAGSVRIQDFVYLIGGHDGISAQNTVLRAHVLNPLKTPEIQVALSLLLDTSQSQLTQGVWYYVVSATFPDNDPINPGGESLPSELLTVKLPNLVGMQLTLQWTAVPRASGYIVYRSPAADMSPDDMTFLAAVSGTANRTFHDSGMSVTPPRTPLPRGSLGRWANITTSPLTTPREAMAVTSAINPSNSSEHFIYALGGRDAQGNYLATYEYVKVVPTPGDEDQIIGTWTVGDDQLADARAELSAVVLTNEDENTINPLQSWVFVGPGRTATGFSINLEQNFLNTTTGSLDPLSVNTKLPSGNYGGYCMLDASGFMYTFGGKGGPSQGGTAAQVCYPGLNGCTANAVTPTLRNGAWNSEGTSMTVTRIYGACSQEIPFVFVTGGSTGTELTRNVDRTIQ